MKQFYIILILFLVIYSCNNSNKGTVAKTTSDEKIRDTNISAQDRLYLVTIELNEFEKKLIELYNKSEKEPNIVIEQTQNIIEKIKMEPDPNNVRSNKLGSLYDLRAEIYYKTGQFQKSINEINKRIEIDEETIGLNFLGSSECNFLACNYAGLKDFMKAKSYIDSAGKGYYLSDYILGNYYEVIGKFEKALKIYSKIIKEDKERNHYDYYGFTIKRVEELNKPNPKLLTGIYYPTSRPDYINCKTDNNRRTKIFDLILNLPEVKSCKGCDFVSIYRDPNETKSSFYWIKVGHNNNSKLELQFNFLVDSLTFEIKYFDTISNRQFTLAEWRKNN